MKIKIYLIIAFISTLYFNTIAQSPKYENAMRKNVAILDTAKTPETMQLLANNFERIASAEKTQWMPYYYAGICYMFQGYVQQDKSKLDVLADRAEKLAKLADSLSPKNSEVMCLMSMVNSTRIMVDPMNRGMQYGMASSHYLQMAKTYNAENPRSYYLEGTGKLYTPEQFGGGKAIAKPLLQKAVDKFAAFKADPDYAPHWGAERANMMLKKCDE